MSKNQTYELERAPRPEDDLANGYFELLRSVDYSNEELYSNERLEALGLFWLEEEDNPLRSPRGQAEAKHITKLLSFECAYRQGRIDVLIDFYKTQV